MEHRWSSEFGNRNGGAYTCDNCGAIKYRPKNDVPKYVGKDGKWTDEPPICKQEEVRARPGVAT